MKSLLLIPAFALTVLFSSFQNPVITNQNQTLEIQNQIEGLFGEEDCAPGVVYYFTQNGIELPYQSPYVFHFCPDGSITAVGSDGNYTGSWEKTGQTVSITIYGPHEIFELVSGVWNIIEHTENALELETYNKYGQKHVRFERIQR